MAMKSLLFLLAYLVLVTITVSSLDEELLTKPHAPAPAPIKAYGHPPKKAHAHAPTPHVHHPPKKAPKKAPAHSPIPYVHPPVKAPVHPPMKAPAPPPVKAEAPETPIFPGCSGKCVKYCDGKPQKRWCQRVCTACCSKCKCVPGKEKPCSGWDKIVYHRELVTCP